MSVFDFAKVMFNNPLKALGFEVLLKEVLFSPRACSWVTPGRRS
jgi:hypothetical protein